MKSDTAKLFSEGAPLSSIPVCDHYAGSEKLVCKSVNLQRELGALFDITCDLEDGAVAGDGEELKRSFLAIIASDQNPFNQIGLRVRDYASGLWRNDITDAIRAAGDRLSHLTFPKAIAAWQIEEVVAHIRKVESQVGLKREIPLHVLIETLGALREVWEIAAVPGLRGLDFGAMDFVSCLHGALDSTCMRAPRQFEHPVMVRAKTEIVLASLANGLTPAHNVTPEFNSTDRTFDDALRARTQFGFLRMWSVHPVQVRAIIDAMKPDFNEVKRAEEIIERAAAAGWAPLRIGDEFHDKASFRYFWEILGRAIISGVAVSEGARSIINGCR